MTQTERMSETQEMLCHIANELEILRRLMDAATKSAIYIDLLHIKLKKAVREDGGEKIAQKPPCVERQSEELDVSKEKRQVTEWRTFNTPPEDEQRIFLFADNQLLSIRWASELRPQRNYLWLPCPASWPLPPVPEKDPENSSTT